MDKPNPLTCCIRHSINARMLMDSYTIDQPIYTFYLMNFCPYMIHNWLAELSGIGNRTVVLIYYLQSHVLIITDAPIAN